MYASQPPCGLVLSECRYDEQYTEHAVCGRRLGEMFSAKYYSDGPSFMFKGLGHNNYNNDGPVKDAFRVLEGSSE